MYRGRYQEARDEKKLRNQKEDFSDMVAEVCPCAFIYYLFFVGNGLVEFEWCVLCRMLARGRGSRRRKERRRRRNSSFRRRF
jgi:hypothetical protein